MSSHGQNPSRKPNDERPQVPSSDVDSSLPGTYGGGHSKRAGGPEQNTANASAQTWFPASGRYQRLSDPIAGGMGVVYKALDVNLDIEVAIKRIRPELAADEDLINRFEREAKLQVRLRHANLVQVRDYSKDEIGPYIVMDWINGRSLAAEIETNGPMEWPRAAKLISKVAMALQIAHEAGIIHRDVKPANILLDANGEPYITDFGLARIEATHSRISETATNAMLGTINFASPEQQRNPRNACFQSDIWSLGATLYQLLTGHDVLGMRESLIPRPLREIVLKATERAIADRYQDMKGFSGSLQNAVADESPKPVVLPSAPPEPEPTSSSLADLWRRMREQVEQTQAEARAIAENRQDYAAAAKMLEGVPEHLRDAGVFNEVTRRRDRVAALDSEIQKSVAQLQTKGLREAIQELLQLQPKRKDMLQLLAELPEESPVMTPQVIVPAGHGLSKSGRRPELLAAPFSAKEAAAAQEAWARYLGIGVEVTNGIGMKFRVIPPGTFDMGSPKSEPDRSDDETLHKVTITQPKLLGSYPVTQSEWTNVMGSNPSCFKSVSGQDTTRFPVEQVSWDDCQEFLTRLSQSHSMKGWRYRLPTEAEWEYACRAGTVTPFWFGGELDGKQANCDGNHPYQTVKGPYLQRTCTVGSYGANPFGLFDQHGNVREWCQDWHAVYDASMNQDPTGPTSGSSRVLRGGSWYYNANRCRSAYRFNNVPSYRNIGFRVLCELS